MGTTHDVLPERHGAGTLHQRLLHGSASVTIHDVHCRPLDHAHGPEEWCTENQIVFPRSGLFVREANGLSALGNPNHVLFFQKHEVYRVSHPVGRGDDCTVYCFADEVLREAIASFDPTVEERPDQPFPFQQSSNELALFLLQERLRQAAASPGIETLALDEAALTLLDGILASAYRKRGVQRGSATARIHREQAERTKLLLAARFTEDLSLDQVAHAVHCSPFHLARLFRAQTGLTVHQYRHRLRLSEALERVLAGEQNLSAMALTLGFSSHAHLSDPFPARLWPAPLGVPGGTQRGAPARAGTARKMSRILKVAWSRPS